MTNDKFFVELPSYNRDNNGFYKRTLLNTIEKKYPWLTVAGLDSPFKTPKGNVINGVQNAGPGSLLTFGTGRQHDVNWVKRPSFAAERGYEPILNPITNWNTIMNKLDTFAMNRKPIQTRYSSDFSYLGNNNYIIGSNNVTITDDFIYVGIFVLCLCKPSFLVFLRIREHTSYSIAFVISRGIDTTKTIVVITKSCKMIDGWNRHLVIEFQFIGLLVLTSCHSCAYRV